MLKNLLLSTLLFTCMSSHLYAGKKKQDQATSSTTAVSSNSTNQETTATSLTDVDISMLIEFDHDKTESETKKKTCIKNIELLELNLTKPETNNIRTTMALAVQKANLWYFDDKLQSSLAEATALFDKVFEYNTQDHDLCFTSIAAYGYLCYFLHDTTRHPALEKAINYYRYIYNLSKPSSLTGLFYMRAAMAHAMFAVYIDKSSDYHLVIAEILYKHAVNNSGDYVVEQLLYIAAECSRNRCSINHKTIPSSIRDAIHYIEFAVRKFGNHHKAADFMQGFANLCYHIWRDHGQKDEDIRQALKFIDRAITLYGTDAPQEVFRIKAKILTGLASMDRQDDFQLAAPAA